MDFEKTLTQYSKQLSPSREQQDRVLAKVLGQSGVENTGLFFSKITMLHKLNVHGFRNLGIGVVGLAAFVGIPAVVAGGFSSSQLTAISPITENSELVDYGTTPSYSYRRPEAVADGSGANLDTKSPTDTSTPEAQRAKAQTASITLTSGSVREHYEQVRGIATKHGGFITSSSLSGTTALIGSVTMKVPADKFEVALADVHGLGLTVESESVQITDKQDELIQGTKRIEDTKKEIVELEAQIAKEKDQSKLTNLKNQLKAAQNRLAVSEGQQKQLISSTDFSTITVSLKEQKNQFLGGVTAFGDWSSIAQTLKTVIVFWAQVLIWAAIPALAVIYLRKKGGKAKAKGIE